MNIFRWAFALACICSPLLSQAQTAASTPAPADYIVAVVNSEPITNSELMQEMRRIVEQLTAQRQPLPPPEEIRKGVLERMINDRAQLQQAREVGVVVQNSEVDMAEQNVARQNQIDLTELHKRLAKEGLTATAFRSQLRDQMLLSRLREHEVTAKIKITDVDVERFIAAQKSAVADPFAQEVNLAQIFIAVPEHASVEQVAYFELQAKNVLARLRNGENFAKVVQEVSAADRNNGGALGMRRGDRYPPSFIQATFRLPVGGVSELVRSGAGFHILKVLERRQPAAVAESVPEIHSRHILLRLSPQLTAAQATAKLTEVRARIVNGGDFAKEAKEISQDGSAAQGGDLGWARAGMFVPEFEEVLARLKDGEISPPFQSRFGVHLVQVLEHRRADLTPAEIRETVRTQLRESRYDEAMENWARDIRDKAFVEYRDPPL